MACWLYKIPDVEAAMTLCLVVLVVPFLLLHCLLYRQLYCLYVAKQMSSKSALGWCWSVKMRLAVP